MDGEAMLWGDAMDDAMDDAAMLWGDAMGLCYHRIAASSIASPHRPSHRLIVHRVTATPV